MPRPETSRTDILYLRQLPYGPAVRIRRVSPPGERPVIAVLDVDRRFGTSRDEEQGDPPPLMIVEADSEAEALSQLQPHANDDATIVRLMREKGQR